MSFVNIVRILFKTKSEVHFSGTKLICVSVLTFIQYVFR